MKKRKVNFIDITDWPDEIRLFTNRPPVLYPTATSHSDTVRSLNDQLDADHIKRNLDMFTSFNNRYYLSESGNLSAEWLLGQAQNYPKSGSPMNVAIFPHVYRQSSIFAAIPGRSNKTIVVGAHQDSINSAAGGNKRIASAPGAGEHDPHSPQLRKEN
jgi:leucyl aminopeptidase